MNEKPDKQAEKRLIYFEDCAEAIDQLFKAALSNKRGRLLMNSWTLPAEWKISPSIMPCW
jgi:hypothetical protein